MNLWTDELVSDFWCRGPWPAESVALLGTAPDGAVARLLGVTRSAVSYQRRRRDIPAHVPEDIPAARVLTTIRRFDPFS